jgi:hypothetical protein
MLSRLLPRQNVHNTRILLILLIVAGVTSDESFDRCP